MKENEIPEELLKAMQERDKAWKKFREKHESCFKLIEEEIKKE